MSVQCYNCGVELVRGNATVEHIPAQNLYQGFNESFKKNRLTVPCCYTCNNEFSKIDQEIRDIIGIASNEVNLITQKAVKSILRRSNWKDRTYFDQYGNVQAVDFSYDDLKKLHIKHFKGIFYDKYKIPLPNYYTIEIIADGDDDLNNHANIFYDLLTSGNEIWQVSGSSHIFKYIHTGVKLDFETDLFQKTDNLVEATFIASILVYHEHLAVVIVAATEEYLKLKEAFYSS